MKEATLEIINTTLRTDETVDPQHAEEVLMVCRKRLGQERLYRVPEVARHLGVHVQTIRRWVREGSMQAVRAGRQLRIPASQLDGFPGA